MDYFPHVCNHGQTMFIVEQRFGNDGYAFWFKLLETLGVSEGHYIDLGNPTAWEFLQAKTRLGEGFCTQILDLLARLGAIDRELWEGAKVVWSQKFVDGVADVYKNRRVETPLRPSFYSQKPHSEGVSTDGNPQSKLKETKEKESRIVLPPSAADDDTASLGPTIPYSTIISHYHMHCAGWPRAILTPDRRRVIGEWWQTLNGEAHKFELAFKRAGASDFLSGRNGQWKAPKPCDLDWLLSKSNLASVLEGAYDNRQLKPASTADKPRQASRAAIPNVAELLAQDEEVQG